MRLASKRTLAILGLFLICVFPFLFSYVKSDPRVEDSSTQKLYTLVRGPFQYEIKAYGTIESDSERLLSSDNAGRVKAIYHKPGSTVVKGERIVSLESQEVFQGKERALAELRKLELEVQELYMRDQLEKMEIQSRIRSLESEHRYASLEYQANKTLAEQNALSSLQLKKTEMAVANLKEQVDIQRELAEIYEQVHIQRSKIVKERIEYARSTVDDANAELLALEIVADEDMTVQEIYVTEGEQLPKGTSIAKVVTSKDLVASISVPQYRAASVFIGASAYVQVNGREYESLVTRVDPLVKEGAVNVQLAFIDGLSESVRPKQSITARIVCTTDPSSYYVEDSEGLVEGDHIRVKLYSKDGEKYDEAVAIGVVHNGNAQIIAKSLHNNQSVEFN